MKKQSVWIKWTSIDKVEVKRIRGLHLKVTKKQIRENSIHFISILR